MVDLGPAGLSPLYQWGELSPLYISLDCVNFYEVPEGMDVQEFIEQLKRRDDDQP